MADKKQDHADLAEQVAAKLPKQVRDRSEIVAGSGAYSLLKVDGRTVASVRGNGARVTYRTDAAEVLAAAIKEAVATAPDAGNGDADD
jgi:phosphosulfolactate phosphohydrolase-like enzyme